MNITKSLIVIFFIIVGFLDIAVNCKPMPNPKPLPKPKPCFDWFWPDFSSDIRKRHVRIPPPVVQYPPPQQVSQYPPTPVQQYPPSQYRPPPPQYRPPPPQYRPPPPQYRPPPPPQPAVFIPHPQPPVVQYPPPPQRRG